MINNKILRNAILSTFPSEPIPSDFFVKEGYFGHEDVIRQLATNIQGKNWQKITVLDWMTVGGSPVVFREALLPSTFAYYLPSLLSDDRNELGYIEYILYAIMPNNKHYVPKGEWWQEFYAHIDGQARQTIVYYLVYIDSMLDAEIYVEAKFLIDIASQIWGG